MEKFPLIIGHRGCKYPGILENSCEAVERAIREGADIIELDVVCGENVRFVGYHPNLFWRKPISSKDKADSFESLLKTIDNRAMLYADIKENLPPEKMDEFLNLIKKYYTGQIIIGSFYETVLRYFRKKEPGCIINYHCFATVSSIKRAISIGADWINPMPFGIMRRFILEAMKGGLKFVPAGTENYQKQLRYAKLGAYAISVFKPAIFIEWLRSKL